jgi:cytochrome c oxidase cbb3-type subunit 2
MNKLWIIFVGIMLTFASAWLGLAMLPSEHYGFSQGARPAGEGEALIAEGQRVYQSYGCIYCHSQQVSPRNFRSDQERGWGTRRTVPEDYRDTGRALLGTMRTGPDLSNVGVRLPSAQWHYLHFYNPQATSAGSTMPPFAWLFDVLPAGETREGAIGLPDGTSILPKREAEALVAYLLSLKLTERVDPTVTEAPPKR